MKKLKIRFFRYITRENNLGYYLNTKFFKSLDEVDRKLCSIALQTFIFKDVVDYTKEELVLVDAFLKLGMEGGLFRELKISLFDKHKRGQLLSEA